MALVDDRDAVGKVHDLIQLLADEEDADSFPPLLQQLLVDELDGSHVQAACGIDGDEELRGAGDLPRQDDLLDVASREAACGRGRVRGADVEALLQLFGVAVDLLAPEEAVAAEALLVAVLQDEVLLDGEGGHDSLDVPLLGDVAHAMVDDVPGLSVGYVDSEELYLALDDGPEAVDRLGKLPLAVSGDAGQSHDLALVHVEREVVQSEEAAVGAHRDVLDRECDGAIHVRLLVLGQYDLMARHQRGDLAGRVVRRVAVEDDGPVAQDDDLVAQCLDLVQLVADEDDAELLLHAAQQLDELVRLLRGQGARRLVQDEEAGSKAERLDELHPLLLTYRQLPDVGVGIDGEAVVGAHLLHPPLHQVQIEAQRLPGLLVAQGHVLRDRHVGHEHVLLMHHSQTRLEGVLGATEVLLLTVYEYPALILLVDSHQDIHKRRLAGTVLADQGQDLALVHAQRNVVGCEHAWKALGYMLHPELSDLLFHQKIPKSVVESKKGIGPMPMPRCLKCGSQLDVGPVGEDAGRGREACQSLVDSRPDLVRDEVAEGRVVVEDEAAVAEVQRDAHATLHSSVELLDDADDDGGIVVCGGGDALRLAFRSVELGQILSEPEHILIVGTGPEGSDGLLGRTGEDVGAGIDLGRGELGGLDVVGEGSGVGDRHGGVRVDGLDTHYEAAVVAGAVTAVDRTDQTDAVRLGQHACDDAGQVACLLALGHVGEDVVADDLAAGSEGEGDVRELASQVGDHVLVLGAVGDDQVEAVGDVLACDGLAVDCGHLLGILEGELAGQLLLCGDEAIVHGLAPALVIDGVLNDEGDLVDAVICGCRLAGSSCEEHERRDEGQNDECCQKFSHGHSGRRHGLPSSFGVVLSG